ncbi:UNVERIFIED_CONTAM: glycine dehydrogenase, partial [Mumia flava]
MNAPHPASSALAAERPTLADLEARDAFAHRHIGPSADEQTAMLGTLGYTSRAALIDAVIPPAIRRQDGMPLGEFTQPLTEEAALAKLRGIAGQNRVVKSLIGQGYYGTHTPGVILRNILENPAWYTAYTPYQPEISQGRLEAMLNFQQMVIDLTAMDIANASMLDEATAAAEAMTLLQRIGKSKSTVFFVADDVLPQTLEVVRTRAEPIGVQVVTGPAADAAKHDAFGVLLQYPGANGALLGDLATYQALTDAVHAAGGLVVAAADLLALTLLAAPGEWGADVVIGNTQRFGVPFGFGGPHAGYMAVRDAFKRSMPGRLVGVTIDAQGNPAYRLALQTREQHIRREKATSNICTAQVLLGVMASMYAVYHGPQGLKRIAQRVHRLTATLAAGLRAIGYTLESDAFFDTLTVATGPRTANLHIAAQAHGINLRQIDDARLGISLDETVTRADVVALWEVFAHAAHAAAPDFDQTEAGVADAYPASLIRQSAYLTHPVFN